MEIFNEYLDVLADIIRTYDLIAIQEIRDASQTSLPALVNIVNADSSQYDYVVSAHRVKRWRVI